MPIRFAPHTDGGARDVPPVERIVDGKAVTQEVSTSAERTIISLHGPFDIDHAPEIWTLLRQSVQQYRCVLVDLSDVPHMDSAGLASLAEAHRLARQKQTSFALIGVNQQVLKMLKLSGLQRMLRLYPTVAKALTSLASRDFKGRCQTRTFSESLARNLGSPLNAVFSTDLVPMDQRRVA